ncbi:MAG: RNA-binding protein, partial [Bradyrhizobiaceae bacterium]|nr:RNA-binding protein [Bradyrhizobiaceae bacterium]
MLARLDDDTDHGPRTIAAGTTRLCAATRAVKPIEDMIRFVRDPGGAVVPDLKRKLPGRGVWVTAQRVALAQAINCGAFRRSFKSEVTVSKDLLASVERLLERSVLDALAIARKAGDVVTGFAAVADAIETKPVIALLHAQDAAVEGHRKLASLLQRRDSDVKGIVTITAFTSAQLDLALGRSNVV